MWWSSLRQDNVWTQTGMMCSVRLTFAPKSSAFAFESCKLIAFKICNHFVIRFVAGMQALFQQRTRPQSSWWWRPREDNYISNGSWHVLASVSLEVRRCDAGWSPKVWTSWPIDAERWKDVLEHRLHRLDVVFPLELARQIVAGLPSGKLTVRYGKSYCLMGRSTMNCNFQVRKLLVITRGYSHQSSLITINHH